MFVQMGEPSLLYRRALLLGRCGRRFSDGLPGGFLFLDLLLPLLLSELLVDLLLLLGQVVNGHFDIGQSAAYLLKLEALRKTLSKNTTLILDTNTPPYDLLRPGAVGLKKASEGAKGAR